MTAAGRKAISTPMTKRRAYGLRGVSRAMRHSRMK